MSNCSSMLPIPDTPCTNSHRGINYGSDCGVISEIEITKDGFKFCFGTQMQVIEVKALSKPDWIVNGIRVEIDFNNHTITEKT